MNFTLACSEPMTVNAQGLPVCSGVLTTVVIPEQFDIQNLDPIVLGQFFGVGFTMVATVLIGAIGAKAVLDFIKSA